MARTLIPIEKTSRRPRSRKCVREKTILGQQPADAWEIRKAGVAENVRMVRMLAIAT